MLFLLIGENFNLLGSRVKGNDLRIPCAMILKQNNTSFDSSVKDRLVKSQ